MKKIIFILTIAFIASQAFAAHGGGGQESDSNMHESESRNSAPAQRSQPAASARSDSHSNSSNVNVNHNSSYSAKTNGSNVSAKTQTYVNASGRQNTNVTSRNQTSGNTNRQVNTNTNVTVVNQVSSYSGVHTNTVRVVAPAPIIWYSRGVYRQRGWGWGTMRPIPLIYTFNNSAYYDWRYYQARAVTALNQIDILEQQRANSIAAASQIAAIRIVNARFYKQYFTAAPAASMAEITVTNNGNQTISQIAFQGRIVTHISSNILIDQPFVFVLPDVLGPGETKTYSSSLNSFGDWAQVNAPDLAVFEVNITGLQTIDGQIFAPDFTPDDQARLDSLRNVYVR